MAKDYCDLNCRYASWPKDLALDGAGSCRTFQAIFCERKERSVYKNAHCMEKETRSRAPSRTNGTRRKTR
jgi:hypothetical protein